MSFLKLSFPLLTIVLLLTACWDRTEINEYAFWIGSAIDLNQDGSFKVSAQIAIPSQFRSTGGSGSGSEKGKATIVLTATGVSLIKTLQDIQEQLPRRIFSGHRRAVFISEKMARSGIKDALDQFLRNPDTRLRTDVFVIKGGEAKDALEVISPFNPFSAVAAVDQDKFSRIGDTQLRDLFLDATRDGIRPTMSVIELPPSSKQEKKYFLIQASALYNKKLEMVGTLSKVDSMDMFWIKGIQHVRYILEEIEKSNYSIYESNLRSNIKTEIQDGKIKVKIKLSGNGRMLENNKNTDLSSPHQLSKFERAVNEKTKEHVEKMIKTVQEKYGQDVFGFGEVVHREHPNEWKAIKDDWDQMFPIVSVSVDVHLHIRNTGKIDRSLNF